MLKFAHLKKKKNSEILQNKKKQCFVFGPRNFKGGIGSLFDPCVNAMGRRPYWPSRMEVSYCKVPSNSDLA